MTSEDIWKQLVERHPSFEAEENLVSLRARGLKALINQAWSEGYATATRKNADIFTDKGNVSDLFKHLFKN